MGHQLTPSLHDYRVTSPTCYNSVPLVVEGTAEDLVRVSLKDLPALSRVWIPQAGSLVRAGRHHQRALGVEGYLWGNSLNGHYKFKKVFDR